MKSEFFLMRYEADFRICLLFIMQVRALILVLINTEYISTIKDVVLFLPVPCAVPELYRVFLQET